MRALLKYEDQVAFLRRWMKEGRLRKVGTWSKAAKCGDLWSGECDGFRVHFKTEGRLLVASSFRVSTA